MSYSYCQWTYFFVVWALARNSCLWYLTRCDTGLRFNIAITIKFSFFSSPASPNHLQKAPPAHLSDWQIVLDQPSVWRHECAATMDHQRIRPLVGYPAKRFLPPTAPQVHVTDLAGSTSNGCFETRWDTQSDQQNNILMKAVIYIYSDGSEKDNCPFEIVDIGINASKSSRTHSPLIGVTVVQDQIINKRIRYSSRNLDHI
jgi:hypothetical protein